MTAPLLEVEDLHVTFGEDAAALGGVSFILDRGDSIAVIGESGSGKTTLALALAGLVQPPVARGSVRLEGTELLGADERVLRQRQWSKVAIALQGAPLNPVERIRPQIEEPMRHKRGDSRSVAADRAAALADEVLLPRRLLERFPHELSGGERRRAALAMVLALDPMLVVLDEPTAGLDRDTAGEIVEIVLSLSKRQGFGLVSVSHDLDAATLLGRRLLVLYGGQIMESGAATLVRAEPAHPYSAAFVNAFPVMTTTKDLRPIRGSAPDARAVPSGCPFHPRCTQADDRCVQVRPRLELSRDRLVACHFGGLKTLLLATSLTKTYRTSHRTRIVLDDVSITVNEGESVAVVGASGSGKSTLARILTGHLAADAGSVVIGDEELTASWRGRASKELRRRVQLVMQDPSDALSPRLAVVDLIGEPLEIAGAARAARHPCVSEMLERVGLPASPAFLAARTHELSGGQLQRVALARALIVRPKLLVADEPTSMLDPSEQARLLVVLRELQVEMGLGLVFISHDFAVVRKMADRVVVLDGGRIVEQGRSEHITLRPREGSSP